MNPVLSLETSRRLYELVGERETELEWACRNKMWNLEGKYKLGAEETIPAYSFAECIRLLPALGEKLGWAKATVEVHAKTMLGRYMLAPTPQEGMEAVESYLAKLLV